MSETSEAAAGPTRTRMAPEARKDLLKATAREVFAERGYASSGLAEIADRAGVNKRLLYYYFPDGRSELFGVVMAELTADLTDVMRGALAGPYNTAKRIERLVGALIEFFTDQPDAFDLLFRDPFGVREPEILGEAVKIQADLAREFSVAFASSGLPTETLLAVAFGTLAYVMRVIELRVRGDVDDDAALDACMTCVLGVMSQIGMRA